MKNSRHSLRNLTVSAAMLLSMGCMAQSAATDAFVSAPQHIFPLLDHNTRLDMIDYFNSGMSNASANRVQGRSRVTAISPQSMNVEMSAASGCQIAILPAGRDSLVALITTVKSPAPDSRMDIFSSSWVQQPDNKYFVKPSLTDWLTPEGKKNSADVEAFVPFIMVGYSYDPDTSTLTLTNNSEKFLSEDIYAMVGQYLRPSLEYKWNGKKFVAQ